MFRFVEAMKSVYGPFEDLSDEEAKNWTPPSDPGAGGHRGRYLWTDAFGVINFITLSRELNSNKYIILAKRLVASVHDTLGRTRDGSERLKGATDENPLMGGLRIGKVDESGTDCDGQYHHYLTVWMFALNRLSLATGEPLFNSLAIQLAKAIHPRFVVRRTSTMRMVWKISTDMETVLVPSEGHLDAATGFVVYDLLQHTAARQGQKEGLLREETSDYRAMMNRKGGLDPSDDPLDLGMGLWMCHLQQDESWAVQFLQEALEIAKELLGESSALMLRDPSRRLAFREFGTCLGISCCSPDEELEASVCALLKFWQRHLQENLSFELKPISQVMYAAALVPGAFRKEYLGNE